MEYAVALTLVALCMLGMASGWIIMRKVLRRGCTLDPDSDPNEPCGICGKQKSDCPENEPDQT